jgi:CubicO group peptidase (beta-lactamase class C family)
VLDLDAPVARYWPEFARAGKQAMPVRWLLTHQAALAALDRRLSRTELLSWTPVIKALEAQSPNWPPGTAHGYHSMIYGFLVGEVIRRVTGQFPGPWITSHVSAPLDAPATWASHRCCAALSPRYSRSRHDPKDRPARCGWTRTRCPTAQPSAAPTLR